MPLFYLVQADALFPVNNKIPLSLYVHIPWCVKKCPYCDFNSFEKNDFFDEEMYVKALLIDLDNEYINYQQDSLSSIFFGGGTPSLFSADAIHRIIQHARQLFKFTDIETTLEANPGAVDVEKFSLFKDAGVNRLSIGIQSFNEAYLKSLGRIHNSQQALSAIDAAKNAGFENINLDLMYGLPQQTVQQALNDIHTAAEFNVPHISHYQLTIEENTYFHKYKPALPDNDLIWEMQTLSQDVLAGNDYQQYEISAYAKAGKQCTHNLNYWRFGDYIGIGAGAHGKLTEVASASMPTDIVKITRAWKHRQPQEYIKQTLEGKSLSGVQELNQRDAVFEFLLNALRLKQGCDMKTFVKHTGLDCAVLERAVENIDSSLLFFDKNKITTTDKGFLFLNDILEELL
ncbi:MAG: radical SAM family heme chaperone HemW [Gammaproteobacteria bacterium]|nr:radical SAM family heme chaperone HemW [Gammaproteobacteria bacterium]